MAVIEALSQSPTFGLTPDARRLLQRGALYVVLASVAVSAPMGAFALLIGDLGDTQFKLLGTSLSVSGASAIALVCGFAWERGRIGVVPPLGIALGVAGFALMNVAMWAELDSDGWLKSIGTLLALALAATHASVVSPFGLARRFRGVFAAAYSLNALTTALVVIAMWVEPDADFYWRFTATVAILLTAATIAIPVLRRLAPPAPAREARPPAGLEGRYCPSCGAPLDPPGASLCARCGARFEVRFAGAAPGHADA